MATKKPEPLFYIIIRDVKTRPKYKTRMITIYKNGTPTELEKFHPWLIEAIEEKVGK